ncbi:MAG: host attachment protein [Alphaproteobacteria bacterium]|nr:host attachment protein [Alphaproteobacteria bacterium]
MTGYGRTWIVVLDEAGARFLRREPTGEWMPAATKIDVQSSAATPEERRQTREHLLRETMRTVDTACGTNQCDSLVVVAPERLLGRFRSTATDRVRTRLWRERAAEAGSLSDMEIGESVEAYFRQPRR